MSLHEHWSDIYCCCRHMIRAMIHSTTLVRHGLFGEDGTQFLGIFTETISSSIMHKTNRKLIQVRMYMESEWVKTFINDAVEKQQDRIILGQEQEKQAKKKAEDYFKVEQRRLWGRTILSQTCRNRITRSMRHLWDGRHDVVKCILSSWSQKVSQFWFNSTCWGKYTC